MIATMAKSCDAEVILHFHTTANGGRRSPCRSGPGGYKAPCDFGRGDGLNDALFMFTDKEWVTPGDTVNARMLLLRPELQVGRLNKGFEFMIHDGGQIVGRGTITKVVRTELHTGPDV